MGNVVCKSKSKAAKYKDTDETKTVQTVIQIAQPKQLLQPVQPVQPQKHVQIAQPVQYKQPTQIAQPVQPKQPVQCIQAKEAPEQQDIIIKCGLEDMVKCFFKDYFVVWHDPDVDSTENKQYKAQLQKFCEVKTFTEWEKASKEIEKTNVSYHVITSGTNGELFTKEISQSQKVSAIYVFCRNKDYHSQWAKNYQKISCVETQIQKIIQQIQQNLLKWYKEGSSLKMDLPAFAPIFNDWDKSGMNNLHRFLKVIPNFKNRLQAKEDFVNLSKAIYSGEDNTKLIALFEKGYKEYNKKDTLNWYTKESFLYRIINKCLRIASSDAIQYCRFLLKDLEQAIKDQYHEKSKNFSGLLYRGAYTSEEEWENLKKNINGEIEMHGFMSASKDKKVALSFLSHPDKMVFITILVPKGFNEEEQGFAEVEEFAMFPHEKEILFNVRSRFTVLETEDQGSGDVSCRHLVLLYGAQGLRKFVTEKNPMQEMLIPNIGNISCSICQGSISQSMFFTPIITEKLRSYFCQKCLISGILKTQNVSFLCIPTTMGEEKQRKKRKLKGILMRFPTKIPMYGYECKKCKAKKQQIYFQCTKCSSERRESWCENCANESLSECLQKGHSVISESLPFSFWCEKMSQKELDHLKFQNKILEGTEIFQQAEMYVESQEYQKAIEYYNIYLERNREKKKDTNLAFAYNNLAIEYKRLAEYKKALELYSQALEIRKSFYSNNHPEVATSLNHMGNVYYSQAEYKKALELYSQALEIRKSFHGSNHHEVATSLNHMGNVYSRQAEYKKALELYSQALEIRKSFYGSNHPEVATCLSNMGNVYESQGDYKKALDLYSQALEIFKSFYGSNHPEVATCLSNMGNVYEAQAEYNKALELYSQALEIRKSFYSNNHPEIATSLNHMGNVYYSQAEYKKALELYSQALEIDKSFYGSNHPEVATSLCCLGNVYYSQAEYKKALELYSQALEIRKSFHGSNHPEVATCLSNMGNVNESQGDYKKALELYSQALEIDKSFYGNHHPRTIVVSKKIQALSH